MRNSLTISDVLALNPCEPYTAEYLFTLWNGREALTAQDFLALEIPKLDRIWVVTAGELLSSEQINFAKQKMLDLITDNTSPYYAQFQQDGLLYGYGPICRFLAEKSGEDSRTFCEEIETVSFNAIVEMVG